MATAADLAIRPMVERDVRRVGEIFQEAFNDLYRRRGYGLVVGDADMGRSIAASYLTLDPSHCLVVALAGKVVGSGFLHVRGPTAGVGPITVEPARQGRGAGRALMRELCRLADAAGVRSLRLIQDAFNETSFGVYARAGFVARETLLRGSVRPRRMVSPAPCSEVRTASADDIPGIVDLERRLLGIHRPRDYELLAGLGDLYVVDRDGIRASLARMVRGGIAVLGPAVAQALEAQLALLAAAVADLPARADVRLLVPARCSDLVEHLLAAGLEIHSLCTYMVRGEYVPFGGYYLPTLFPESG